MTRVYCTKKLKEFIGDVDVNRFWQKWNVLKVGEHSGAFASFTSLR